MRNNRFSVSQYSKRRVRRPRQRSGFTLIEVIVAVLILGITVGAISTVIQRGVRVWRTGHAASEIGQTARITQDVLARDLDNIFYKSESSYNNVFRMQTAALAQRYGTQFQTRSNLSDLQREIQKVVSGSKRGRPGKRSRDRDGQRDAFADLTLETIAPPINLSMHGSENRLSFARSYKARFAGDQDTWGIRRVTLFVRDKVLYRREEDPYGYRMPTGSGTLDNAANGPRTMTGMNNGADLMLALQEQLQRLFALPEEEEAAEGKGGNSDQPAAQDAQAAQLLPTQVRIEEPLCAGVEIFKITYGFFHDGEWVEDHHWDSQGREHRVPSNEDLARLTQGGAGNAMPQGWLPPAVQARMNMPDDLPGYISVQFGMRSPDGKGKLYSFTVYHSLPEAQETDVPRDLEGLLGNNMPQLPHL